MQVDILAHAHLERVGAAVAVAAIRDQPAFDALAHIRIPRADVPGPAGFAHDVPQLCALAAVHQVDLEAPLLGPARTCHRHRDAFDGGLFEPEVLEPPNPVTEDGGDHVFRPRALNRQRGHIGLTHHHVEPAFGGNGAGPEPDIRVGDRQPVAVFIELEQDRVVDQHAVVVAQRHILSLAGLALRQVAGAQDLRQPSGVRAHQLDLALTRDVPQRGTVDQPPVFLLGFPVAGGHQHVVVGGEGGDAFGQCGRVEGRRAQPRGWCDAEHGVPLSSQVNNASLRARGDACLRVLRPSGYLTVLLCCAAKTLCIQGSMHVAHSLRRIADRGWPDTPSSHHSSARHPSPCAHARALPRSRWLPASPQRRQQAPATPG